jgi:hypothetical protein
MALALLAAAVLPSPAGGGRAEGLLVTATDYTASGDRAAFDRSVANACEAGAIPFVSNIALTRIPPVPPACP